jgi:pimeloyl-ACP methyl ester carboxylesterase
MIQTQSSTTKIGAFDMYKSHDTKDTERPILALHGSASSGAIWQPLAKSLEGKRIVLAPDLPGYGSNANISELDASARFGWLGETICSIGGDFDLVGHSFGGAVAMVLANLYPTRIRSVVLYEPIVPPNSQTKETSEVQDLMDLWTSMLRLETEDAMELFYNFWSGTGCWEQINVRAKSRLINDYASVMLDFRQVFTGQLDVIGQTFNGPITLLCGDASHPIATAMSESLAQQFKQASLTVIEGLGHLGPVTHAEKVAKYFKAALDVCEKSH